MKTELIEETVEELFDVVRGKIAKVDQLSPEFVAELMQAINVFTYESIAEMAEYIAEELKEESE